MNKNVAVAYERVLIKMIDRTVECFELVEEVRAGEDRERVLLRRVKTLTEALEVQKSYSRTLYSQLEKSHGEGENLRDQLAEWERLRTTGGPHKGYHDANWANVAAPPVDSAADPSAPPLVRKFNKMPPPHSPAISTGRVTP